MKANGLAGTGAPEEHRAPETCSSSRARKGFRCANRKEG
jgi:hypothetical protein